MPDQPKVTLSHATNGYVAEHEDGSKTALDSGWLARAGKTLGGWVSEHLGGGSSAPADEGKAMGNRFQNVDTYQKEHGPLMGPPSSAPKAKPATSSGSTSANIHDANIKQKMKASEKTPASADDILKRADRLRK
jgi:hypothetical protein